MAPIDAAHALLGAGWPVGGIDLLVRHLADPWALALGLSGPEV